MRLWPQQRPVHGDGVLRQESLGLWRVKPAPERPVVSEVEPSRGVEGKDRLSYNNSVTRTRATRETGTSNITGT